MKTYIIAEAGVNHNGDVDLAFRLIDQAIAAQCDAVKFQIFSTESLASRSAEKAEYQRHVTDHNESQYDMLKKLELSPSTFKELEAYASKNKIDFLTTAFDSSSLCFLLNELSLPRLKVASGELTNGPLLLEHAQSDLPIILSTGMATVSEIEEALGVLAFGYLHRDNPNRRAFREAFRSDAGFKFLQERVTLLHCTTEYPAPFSEINLKVLNSLRQMFGLRVGYSDHTAGIEAAIAAVSLGAEIIEKHFTLDKGLPGPDHKASLEPDELIQMVSSIRHIEQALGDGIKRPSESEVKNKSIARKSLFANRKIIGGARLRPEDISILRPGTGISPMDYWDSLNKVVVDDLECGEMIDV